MKVRTITPVFVDIVPDHLQDGILYICERYGTAVHKCCCGCGVEVITPLGPVDWSVKKEGKTVSLSPSIGNWSFKCRSHYWVKRNRVVWAGAYSQKQIEKIRALDRKEKDAYISEKNREKERQSRPDTMIVKLWQACLRWWKS
jgi:hypothetical protein